MFRKQIVGGLLALTGLSTTALAQDAQRVIAEASKAQYGQFVRQHPASAPECATGDSGALSR